jgi:hypothetical protein
VRKIICPRVPDWDWLKKCILSISISLLLRAAPSSALAPSVMVSDWFEVDAVNQEDVAITKAIEDQLITTAKTFVEAEANRQAAINTHQEGGLG